MLLSALLALVASPGILAQSPQVGPSLQNIRRQIDTGRLQSAEDSIWSVLSSQPTNTEALNLLGVIRGKQQRFAEAESLFRRVVALNQGSASGYSNLASALIAENKIDQAIEALKQAEVLAPKLQEPKLLLAQLYLGKNDYQGAFAELKSFSARDESSLVVPLMTKCLIGLGRDHEALSLAQSRNSPSERTNLAEIFVQNNMPDAALGLLPNSASSNRIASRIAYVRGQSLELKKDFAGARQSFEKAVALDGRSVESLMALASSYAHDSEHGKAAEALRRADQLTPDNVSILRELIFHLIKSGQNEIAATYAATLVKLSPDNPDDLFLVGTAMLQFKDYPAAEQVLTKYLKLRPEDGRAYLALGAGYREQQRYSEAEVALSKARDMFPEQADGEVEYQLGLLAQRKGDDQKAIESFQRVIASHPEHAQAFGALGSEYLKSGNLKEAAAALEHSVTMDGNNPETHYQLSLLYKRSGRLELAREQMEIFRKLRANEESVTPTTKMESH